jgi:predicted alpha/beta-fold hydrolase
MNGGDNANGSRNACRETRLGRSQTREPTVSPDVDLDVGTVSGDQTRRCHSTPPPTGPDQQPMQTRWSPFPPFRPFPLLAGAHLQTVGATYLTRCPSITGTSQHRIDLADGDQLVVQDDRPANWHPTHPVAMLIHGLTGCHASTYMVRTATKLVAHGVRTFRLDMRGCGAGRSLAKHSMHAGRGDDVQAAIEFLAKLCPWAPRAGVGFSLGGLTLLRAIADHNTRTEHSLSCAMAISPPIDLQVCSETLRLPRNKLYNRQMARWLYRYVVDRRDTNPAVAACDTGLRPRSIYEFDAQFTAPLGGFDSVEHYYTAATVSSILNRIRIPTLVLAAQDDPLIPFAIFEKAHLSASTVLYAPERGGHVGFLARRDCDPDRWWLDWRIVDWVLAHAVKESTPSSV